MRRASMLTLQEVDVIRHALRIAAEDGSIYGEEEPERIDRIIENIFGANFRRTFARSPASNQCANRALSFL
jgi:hypothetical protein